MGGFYDHFHILKNKHAEIASSIVSLNKLFTKNDWRKQQKLQIYHIFVNLNYDTRKETDTVIVKQTYNEVPGKGDIASL